jgi:DNA-binding response OmpR family regulator
VLSSGAAVFLGCIESWSMNIDTLQPRERPNVILVEDDPGMQRMVSDYLIQNEMKVTVTARRDELMRHVSGGRVDLVILDLNLGTDDGLDLLRTIRATTDIPVIITTGQRRDEIDRVVGLELGADDYITKPFGLRELLARVRVALRRLHGRERPREPGQTTLRFGRWSLDRRLRRLTEDGGATVALTKGEYALLVAFLEAPGRPLSREHLLQATRIHEDVFDRSIDVQILRLRRKLEEDPSSPRIIRTDRGVGYVFDLTVTEV